MSAPVDVLAVMNDCRNDLDAARMGVAAHELEKAHAAVADLIEALRKAEAALSDIGDADREPGDDVAWCEKRAAEDLPRVRAALARVTGEKA